MWDPLYNHMLFLLIARLHLLHPNRLLCGLAGVLQQHYLLVHNGPPLLPWLLLHLFGHWHRVIHICCWITYVLVVGHTHAVSYNNYGSPVLISSLCKFHFHLVSCLLLLNKILIVTYYFTVVCPIIFRVNTSKFVPSFLCSI